MALNEQQELFCQEYMIDLHQTKAAIRAGYSEASAYNQGYRLMKKDEICIRVKELMKERTDRIGINQDWVLMRLVEISDRCMQVTAVKEWDHDTRGFVENGEYEFDSSGANKATDSIAKHVGFFEKDNDQKKNVITVEIDGE